MKIFLMSAALIMLTTVGTQAECLILGVSEKEPYQVNISLEGLPDGEVFMAGQVCPDCNWKSSEESSAFSIVDNGDETATITIFSWPAGKYFSFSYGRGIWSPTTKGWMDPSCSEYEYDGYFRIQLGKKKPSPPVDFGIVGIAVAVRLLLLNSCVVPIKWQTNDAMIVGVEDLGEANYRLYLNFSGLSGKKGFVGQSAPNSSWEEFSVLSLRKCAVVDIHWPYPGEKIHFSWYGESSQGKVWADAQTGGSSFATCVDGEGNKQFCLDPTVARIR